jgi:hypothetical protein
MAKGKIAAFHNRTGQILSEGNIYNFNVSIVRGGIRNHEEIEFELDENGNVKIIYGKGAEKPKPVNKKKKQESKGNTTKILLTEEK